MQVKQGNIWSVLNQEAYPLVCVTTNNVVTGEGLNMGGGIALQAAQRFPDLRKKAASIISDGAEYNFVIIPHRGFHLGLLQTKYHYKYKSPIYLVERSLKNLQDHLTHPLYYGLYTSVNTVWPGCGLGGLSKEAVRPFLEGMDITVWEMI